jgi:biopolymer transport protein ExbD
MNFRAHAGDDPAQLQLAPLIDIVFLLLIFFIVTTALQQIERQMGIALPEATEGVAPPRQRPPYYINIAKDGTLLISNRTLTYAELGQWLQDLAAAWSGNPPPIVIRADKDTAFKHFVKVIDACTAAKIRNFSIAHVEEPERP